MKQVKDPSKWDLFAAERVVEYGVRYVRILSIQFIPIYQR